VRFDDRARDRQSHSHAAGLGREERLEDAMVSAVDDPDSGVFHQYFDAGRRQLGAQEHPAVVRPCTDGLQRVQEQVEDHLLQLDTIAADDRHSPA
jgi:hypothetical protein